MRILTEPSVYLIARPQLLEAVEGGLPAFLVDNDLEWPTPIKDVSDAERMIEAAGRCCYMSFGAKAGSKTNEKYLDNLIGIHREGVAHGSVCEHANYSFLITGGSRGFSHEVVRHRVGTAFSQLSTRYCDFEREGGEGTWDPGFVVPPLAQLNTRTQEFFVHAYEEAVNNYMTGLSMVEEDLRNHEGFMDALPENKRQANTMIRKAARGAAREMLPIAAEAIMTITMNARTIWNVAVLRANEYAEGMIRNIFVQVLRHMEREMPSLFKGIEYYQAWDGSTCARMPRDKL
jgi:thymidylate synthase (FAD)